jgi:hypothetical protein
MSKGAYTILDTHIGKQSALLAATKQLNKRLEDIERNNILAGIEDTKPQPADIYKTHNFLVGTTWRPHVAVGFEYIKKEKTGGERLRLSAGTKTKVRFTLQDNNGDFISDMVVRVVISAVGDPTVQYGGLLTAPSNTRYRYCDVPGVRLFELVEFKVDEMVVADYTSDDVSFVGFHLDYTRRESYLRAVGQEETKVGQLYMKDYQVTQNLTFRDGPQTAKFYQPALEMWIPLQFWFNTDVKQSLNNIRIKTDQKNIDITLADLTKIIQAVDVNNNVIAGGINSVYIESMELYTKNIYVNEEIRDLYIDRWHMAMIRVQKRHTEIVSKSSGDILLNQLKHPMEYLMFGFRPIANETYFNRWHQFNKITLVELPYPAIINNQSVIPVQQLVVRTATYFNRDNVVSRVGLRAHGNTIYPLTSPSFFNLHTTYTNPDIFPVTDPGKMLISFNLLPGNTTISGHFNISRERELYLMYESSNISDTNTARLYVSAVCINFLIYDTKGILLKYAT